MSSHIPEFYESIVEASNRGELWGLDQFSNNTNQLVMDIEAALARAQSSQGIIPEWAANEITAKADVKYMPQVEINKENELVRHRLVSRLNVWKKSLDLGAEEYLHFGATTVDIFDTVLVLQVKQSIDILLESLLDIESQLLALTKNHIDTYMVGRTIGQHALPMTCLLYTSDAADE